MRMVTSIEVALTVHNFICSKGCFITSLYLNTIISFQDINCFGKDIAIFIVVSTSGY